MVVDKTVKCFCQASSSEGVMKTSLGYRHQKVPAYIHLVPWSNCFRSYFPRCAAWSQSVCCQLLLAFLFWSFEHWVLIPRCKVCIWFNLLTPTKISFAQHNFSFKVNEPHCSKRLAWKGNCGASGGSISIHHSLPYYEADLPPNRHPSVSQSFDMPEPSYFILRQ